MQTPFLINCTHWKDVDLPLSYEVAHFTEALTTVVCYNKKELCETSLPVSPYSNNSLNLRIRVYDSYGTFAELKRIVYVSRFIILCDFVFYWRMREPIKPQINFFGGPYHNMVWREII